MAQLGVRQKLVLLSLLILVVASFGFSLLQLWLSRTWVDEDLRERAVAFTREIAATVGDRRELESGRLLQQQIERILEVRQNVLHLDILAFGGERTSLVASTRPAARLPFTSQEANDVRSGRVVSRLVTGPTGRAWEVMAPIVLDGTVAGSVAALFSLERADAQASRAAAWALALTAGSVLVMGSLMSVAVGFVVTRPIHRFLRTIEEVQAGDTTARVDLRSADELGVLARHFNEMLARIDAFRHELEARVAEATRELRTRYEEVEHLHELLFATQRRLSHAERLALSGRIMAEVAHEVGTPLHSVAGHLELLRQDLHGDRLTEDAHRRLAVIEHQLTRAIQIIAQLLDLTRRPPGAPGPVDLNRVVRETAELVRPGLHGAGLALCLETAENLLTVHGHTSQLQQVVLNLLTNAMDATPPSGTITVLTRSIGGAEVELEVRDTGPGIPATLRKQIFEPFFSTKHPGHGTGLGLFISAQIVREHGGRLDVASEEGQGAVFRVTLPAEGAKA